MAEGGPHPKAEEDSEVAAEGTSGLESVHSDVGQEPWKDLPFTFKRRKSNSSAASSRVVSEGAATVEDAAVVETDGATQALKVKKANSSAASSGGSGGGCCDCRICSSGGEVCSSGGGEVAATVSSGGSEAAATVSSGGGDRCGSKAQLQQPAAAASSGGHGYNLALIPLLVCIARERERERERWRFWGFQWLTKPTNLFKMLLKYRPEDKAAKKERLLTRAKAEAEGKTVEVKKPIVVKYGLNHVTYLIEQNKTQLVVIAHDVDPIELVVWLPALCRKMEIPYCIVKGKARLGAIVHKKTASVLCLTSVKNEDKLEFSKILEAIKAYFNDKFDEIRKKWGGWYHGLKISGENKSQ